MSHCRLLEQENEWKNDVEASIALKDNRSRMIQMEKDELLREVGTKMLIAIRLHGITIVQVITCGTITV